MAKYLKVNGNVLDHGTTVQTSAGAGDADKIPSLNSSGVLASSIVNATVSSAGSGDAAKLVALDGSGKLDSTVMPTGIGADTASIVTSEALVVGLVNLDPSTGLARKADASNGRGADGFVLTSVTSGGTATVYFEGRITGMSGLTAGVYQFLSAATPGGVVATAPSTGGQTWQRVGKAVTTTSMDFEKGEPITL